MNLTGDYLLLGVIGHPIAHSLSPVFQNSALKHLGIKAVYIPMDISPNRLSDAIEGFRGVKNLLGLNVTVPHKEAVLELADWVSEEAKKIGAVNTLRFKEGRIEAYNTDWVGFLQALREITDPSGKRVLVLGAGGASRAVVYALVREGSRVVIWNRTYEKALKLSEEFGTEVVRNVEDALREADVIVNTTSVGLKEDDKPIFDYDLLSPEQVVVDIIYKETPLIKKAKEKGCLYQTGFPMLLYQGAESFRIWTGCEPPIGVMKRSLEPYGYPKDYSRTP